MPDHNDIRAGVSEPWEREKYYGAIRDLIKHEDGLLNERIKILVSLQTLLFGVVATFWKDNRFGVWILCVVGIAIAISYGRDVNNAARTLGTLRQLWPQHCGVRANDVLPKGVPPSVGLDVSGTSAFLLPGSSLPWLFLILWLAVLVARCEVAPVWWRVNC
jgi:hypothetical protein